MLNAKKLQLNWTNSDINENRNCRFENQHLYFLVLLLIKIPLQKKRSLYIALYSEAGKIFMPEDGKAREVEKPVISLLAVMSGSRVSVENPK